MFLYKFRSISNDSFRFTQDIFINKRLYLPNSSILNDPNEGMALIDVKINYKIWGNQLERNRKNRIKVCAFSSTHINSVVWSHYADEHKGICIELDSNELDLDNWIVKPSQLF